MDLDRDPTPGDPEEIRQLAEGLQDFADDVGEALGRIRGMASDRAVQEWAGLSAEAFRAEFDGVPGNLDKLQRSYDMAADALARYWPELQTAQGMADRALQRAIDAQAALASAQTELSGAQDWVSRAGDEAERLREEGEDAPEPPDENAVRQAVRDHQAAQEAASAAQSRVDSAEAELSAARELARQALEMREEAARTCANGIDEASDAGIQNRSWWERAIDWVVDNWDTIVAVCKAIVAVLGIVVLIIGGPLAWVVLAAALVVLADTLIDYANGRASLWDVAFAALDCIPGMKGLTTLGGLARGLRGGLSAARTGLRGITAGVRGMGRGLRNSAREMRSLFCRTDPVDMATGDVVMSATDVDLPGVLPLVLERHHRTSVRNGRLFGASWASTLDQRLVLEPEGVRFHTEDGMVLHYPRPVPGEPVLPVEGPRWGLTWDGEPGTPPAVRQPETGRTLHFAPVSGRSEGELPLAAVTDRNDNRVEVRYDAEGAPEEVVHEGGYRVGIATERGRITELRLLSDPERPVLRSFAYNEAGDLAEIRDASGLPQRLTYDGAHRITAWEDRNGLVYRYSYDADGRCVATEGPGGALSSRIAYDEATHRTLFTDSLGHTTVYQFDDCYQLVTETDPLGHHTHRTWDRYDRLLTLTDPLGRTTTRVHDEDGNLTAVIRPDQLRTTAEFTGDFTGGAEGLHLPATVTEPDGGRWAFAYDERGNLTAVTDPAGHTTRHAYDRRGALTATTDPLGHTMRYEPDAAGRTAEVVNALGAHTRYAYDPLGRVAAITDPAGGTTRLSRTPEGLLARRVSPGGAEERWTYDGEGNELTYTDAAGATSRTESLFFDRPTVRVSPEHGRLEFAYDTELRLTSVTNERGLTWTFTYDAAGRLVGETDYDGRVLTYRYDAAGQLTERVNALGQSTVYVRDALGNVVERRGEDTTDVFTYDALGRLVSAANDHARIRLERDARGRITAEECNGLVTAGGYDPLGRLTHRRTPSGAVSTLDWDAADHPALLRTGEAELRFTYDAAGRELRREAGPLAVTRGWDADHRIISQAVAHGGAAPREQRFTYQAADFLTGVRDEEVARTLDVDAAGRVTAVNGPGWAERYAYNATGDLTHASWPVPEAAPASGGGEGPAAMHLGERAYAGTLIRRAGRTRFEHDAQGRLVRRTQKLLSGATRTWTYAWDSEDRMTGVTTPEGRRWCYRYDPLGRRIGKQRLDGDGNVVEEYRFAWHGTRLAEETHLPTGRTTTWDWDPEEARPLAQTVGDAETGRRFYAIVTDPVGAPAELIDAEGRTVWRPVTGLWGAPAGPDAEGGPVSCPLRFPGQYADAETGLHHNYFRYYDPALCRYLSPDPIGLLGGPNPAWYGGNPTAWTDYFGLALCRRPPRLEDGNTREGWQHIDERHITGNAQGGHGDLMPPTTSRDQVLRGATETVRRGTRVSDPSRRIQTFERRMTVNGFRARYRAVVDSEDGNRLITFFPVGRSFQ